MNGGEEARRAVTTPGVFSDVRLLVDWLEEYGAEMPSTAVRLAGCRNKVGDVIFVARWTGLVFDVGDGRIDTRGRWHLFF